MLRISPNQATIPNEDKDLVTDLTERINGYLQSQDLIAAYPLLTRLSELLPENSGVANITGLVAIQVGKIEEARKCFSRCLQSDDSNFDAQYNLALIDYLSGNVMEAGKVFRRLLSEQPNNPGLRNDLGAALLRGNRSDRALACFSRALKIDPNFSQARNNALEHCLDKKKTSLAMKLLDNNEENKELTDLSKAEIHRWREIFTLLEGDIAEQRVIESIRSAQRSKLALFANHRSFVSAITKELEAEYEIKIFEGADSAAMSKLLNWADLAWFEWCDDLIIQATQLPKSCMILCRLHSYEAFTDMPSQVNWEKVDHLLFVNQSVQQLVASRLPNTLSHSVIHNGVDLSRFTIPKNKTRSKKIASVGYINYKKNPTLLLYCFKKLFEADPEYSLHIAGSHQDPRISLYFEHFLKQHPMPVHFDGWVEDMPSWYGDKGYVISTSLFESFHYSIAEGMASGLIPLIHDWFGAENLYPKEFIFSDPDDFLTLIKSQEERDFARTTILNRKFISDRYDLNDKMKEIRTALSSLVATQPAKIAEATIA